MNDQYGKGLAFANLHKAGTFVLPNPWDAGTARLLTGLGFAALGSAWRAPPCSARCSAWTPCTI